MRVYRALCVAALCITSSTRSCASIGMWPSTAAGFIPLPSPYPSRRHAYTHGHSECEHTRTHTWWHTHTHTTHRCAGWAVLELSNQEHQKQFEASGLVGLPSSISSGPSQPITHTPLPRQPHTHTYTHDTHTHTRVSVRDGGSGPRTQANKGSHGGRDTRGHRHTHTHAHKRKRGAEAGERRKTHRKHRPHQHFAMSATDRVPNVSVSRDTHTVRETHTGVSAHAHTRVGHLLHTGVSTHTHTTRTHTRVSGSRATSAQTHALVLSYTRKMKRCRNVNDAEGVLEQMRVQEVDPDLVCVNVYMNVLAKSGSWKRCIEVLRSFGDRGLRPDTVSYNTAIHACGRAGKVSEAMRLCDDMRTEGLRPNARTYGALLEGCKRAGMWEKALEVLWSVEEPGLVHFSVAMDACYAAGQPDQAREVYRVMLDRGIEPDVIVMSSLAREEARRGSVEGLQALVEDMTRRGQTPDQRWFTCAAAGAAEQGSCDVVQYVLEASTALSMPPTHFTYTSCVRALTKAGRAEEALGLFTRVNDGEVLVDTDTEDIEKARGVKWYTAGLEAMARAGRVSEAKALIEHMSSIRIVPDHVCISLVMEACCEAGRWAEAKGILRGPLRNAGAGPREVMIAQLARAGRWAEALRVVREEEGRGPATAAMYRGALRACAAAGRGEEARHVLSHMSTAGIRLLPMDYARLMDALANGRDPLKAVEVLEDMKEGRVDVQPDLLCCNAALKAWSLAGNVEGGALLLESMLSQGPTPDVVSFNTLLMGAAETGDWRLGLDVLRLMAHLAAPHTHTSTSLSRGPRLLCDPCFESHHTTAEYNTHTYAHHHSPQQPPPQQSPSSSSPPMDTSSSSTPAAPPHTTVPGNTVPEDSEAYVREDAQAPTTTTPPLTLIPASASTSFFSTPRLFSPLSWALYHAASMGSGVIAPSSTTGEPFSGPELASYNMLLQALVTAHQPVTALCVFDEMCSSKGLQPDGITYNHAIVAAGKAGQPDRALSLLRSMTAQGMVASIECVTSAIAAVTAGGWLDTAEHLLREAEATADAAAYACLMGAHNRHHMPGKVLQLYRRMRRRRVEPSRTVMTQVLYACRRSNDPGVMYEALRIMRSRGWTLRADRGLYEAALTACYCHGDDEMGRGLRDEALSHGLAVGGEEEVMERAVRWMGSRPQTYTYTHAHTYSDTEGERGGRGGRDGHSGDRKARKRKAGRWKGGSGHAEKESRE